MYFTDADLIRPTSILASIAFANFREILVSGANKGNNVFLEHPSPTRSSLTGSSKTELFFEQQYNGYLYNLLQNGNDFWVSLIKHGDLGGVFDFRQKAEFYDGIVLLGKFSQTNQMIAKKIVNKMTLTIGDNNQWLQFKKAIKKVIPSAYYDIALTTKNEILVNNKVVFKGETEINAAAYGNKGILVSDKQTNSLILLSGENFADKKTIWLGNYFFQLIVLNGEIIIGKPMYDDKNYINYYLPPLFIY